MLLCLAAAGGLRAQQVVVTGRVLKGSTGRPVARAWVVLHQVSMGGGGQPVDSTRSDDRGAYALTIRRPDSSAIYVVSTWHSGIAYFSEPIAPGRSDLRPLYIYDTSSTGPAVRVMRRLVTVAKEKQDGSRDVLELLELENPGVATRVARDTLVATWAGAIPPVAIQFRVGQGDVSPQVVTRRGDTVAVYGPLPPRERKQLSYTYVLSATVRRVAVPIDQPTQELDLLLEDTAAVVAAERLDSLGMEAVGGRRFARYRTPPLASGAQLAIAFADRRFTPESMIPLVVGLAAVVLAIGFTVALRRKPR
ncbi:MAG TPA: hypothetical protein VN945_01845 [Gemmatimonadales bacterium]|nr:hypothetical protein [Gemmatimonadales bacterium]